MLTVSARYKICRQFSTVLYIPCLVVRGAPPGSTIEGLGIVVELGPGNVIQIIGTGFRLALTIWRRAAPS